MQFATQTHRIHQNYSVFQHVKTGKIYVSNDLRDVKPAPEWKQVLPWRRYHPHFWPSPIAAYLLPPDLEVGDTVWLEDVIEDVEAHYSNQGNIYRLNCCLAVWNGEVFDLLFDKDTDRTVAIG